MFRLLASLRTGQIDSHQIVKNAKYFDILKDHTGDWPAPVRILPRFQFPVIYRIFTNYVFTFPASICQAPVIWWHLIIIEPPVSAIKVSPASIKGWVSAEMVARASSQQWRTFGACELKPFKHNLYQYQLKAQTSVLETDKQGVPKKACLWFGC